MRSSSTMQSSLPANCAGKAQPNRPACPRACCVPEGRGRELARARGANGIDREVTRGREQRDPCAGCPRGDRERRATETMNAPPSRSSRMPALLTQPEKPILTARTASGHDVTHLARVRRREARLRVASAPSATRADTSARATGPAFGRAVGSKVHGRRGSRDDARATKPCGRAAPIVGVLV